MDTRVLIGGIAVLGALAVACEKRSALYCEKHPQDLANCEQTDAAVEPPMACTSNAECSPPYCEPQTHVCVECLLDEHCAPGDRCDPDEFRCRGCIAHADCASDACLPDGSCADAATVLYVESGGDDDGDCTHGAPCATLGRAVALASAARRTIKVRGTWTESLTMNGKDVIILAEPGATMTGATGIDWVLKIQKSIVKIYGLAITCVADQTGVKTEMTSTTTLSGVTITGCEREGAIEMRGGYTVVTRSTLAHNPGGALRADGGADWSITNNFVYRNDGARMAVKLDSDVRPGQRFEFNTVVDNTTPTGTAGIACSKQLVLPNNLIVRNTAAGTSANTSGCDVDGSLVTDDAAPLAFVRPDAEPYDYHIGATSTARDNAVIESTVREDFDGEFRPQGDFKDFGADEYRDPDAQP